QRLTPEVFQWLNGTVETVPLRKIAKIRNQKLQIRNYKSLQRAFAAFVVADANRFVDAGEKNFAVADVAGAGGGDDGFDRFIDHGVGEDDFEFYFGDQIDAVFASAIELGVALLAA